MSRRDNGEVEDGMGFAGLVPTLQEKREEQARNRDAETIRTQSAELAALRAQVEGLRKDAERISYLESNEFDLRTHRETWDCEEGEYSIWWQVVNARIETSISGHPLGSPREAIDAVLAPPQPVAMSKGEVT